MSPIGSAPATAIDLGALGALTPISRSGGQGRVYLPERQEERFARSIVVKLYRANLPRLAGRTLTEMIAWARHLPDDERRRLHRFAAWPLATVTAGGDCAGIVMQDVRGRFEVPFLMPSGRVASVMLQLEHLLGPDDFMRQRGHQITLDTRTRAAIAERICGAFALLHRHAVVVSDVSPSNLLISLAAREPEVAFIDCDSMVFRGRQALAAVETADWQMPPCFAEPPLTRAADAYKLGLLMLRLFARSSDARDPAGHLGHVPTQLHGLLARALSGDASNRPPAGEWQLALRRTLSDEQLSRRHPGPATPRRTPRPARTRVPRERPRPVPMPAMAGSGPPPSHAPTARGGGVPRSFTAVWLLAGVLTLLVFFHLLQSAALPQTAGVREGQPSLSRPGGGYFRLNPEGSAAQGGGAAQGEEPPGGEGGAASR